MLTIERFGKPLAVVHFTPFYEEKVSVALLQQSKFFLFLKLYTSFLIGIGRSSSSNSTFHQFFFKIRLPRSSFF